MILMRLIEIDWTLNGLMPIYAFHLHTLELPLEFHCLLNTIYSHDVFSFII